MTSTVATSGRYRSDMVELDCRSVCKKTWVSPEVEMVVVSGVELEYSYGAGDGQTRSRVASMPKERSGRPGLDQSSNWEKYGYDMLCLCGSAHYQKCVVLISNCCVVLVL